MQTIFGYLGLGVFRLDQPRQRLVFVGPQQEEAPDNIEPLILTPFAPRRLTAATANACSSRTTTFTYDALNRPTLKNYSDATPDVRYFYDAQALPAGAPSFVRGSSLGRLVAVTTGGTNAGTYRGYDELGQVVRQYQRTDSVNYLVEATYNNAGALLTDSAIRRPLVTTH